MLQATDRQVLRSTPRSRACFLTTISSSWTQGGSRQITGLVEAGAFSKLGVITSSFVGRDLLQSLRWTRLGTQFIRDFPIHMSTLTIGDSISAWQSRASQVYYGGVRYASKFSTQPSFIPFALPSMAGEVTVPSSVDLYVNNVRVSQQQVDPGPFSIQNIPVMTGQGDVRMVVTDVMGRQQIVTTSFNRSTTLLRKGVNEYVYEAGSLRYGYGMQHSGYTSVFAAGTQRYGWSNALTLNGRVEIQASNQTFGVGADYALLRIGVASAAVAFSHSDLGEGVLAYGAFQRQTRTFGFSANIVSASSNFRQLGLQPGERVPRLTALAQLSHSFAGGFLSRVVTCVAKAVRAWACRMIPTWWTSAELNSSLNWQLTKRATLVAAFNYAPGSQT